MITPVTPNEINQWVNDFIDSNHPDIVQVIISFGGDRLNAIRDGGGFFAKNEDKIIGVVSYSPTGEYNQPNIIGLYANDVDVAVNLVKHAIDALHSTQKIIVDVIYSIERDTYTLEHLGKDYFNCLDLHSVPL